MGRAAHVPGVHMDAIPRHSGGFCAGRRLARICCAGRVRARPAERPDQRVYRIRFYPDRLSQAFCERGAVLWWHDPEPGSGGAADVYLHGADAGSIRCRSAHDAFDAGALWGAARRFGAFCDADRHHPCSLYRCDWCLCGTAWRDGPAHNDETGLLQEHRDRHDCGVRDARDSHPALNHAGHYVRPACHLSGRSLHGGAVPRAPAGRALYYLHSGLWVHQPKGDATAGRP